MALQKSFILRNGAAGNYVRLSSYVWDRTAREVAAQFSLFTTAEQAAAAPDAPLVPIFAKLRMNGVTFDQYLSNAALAGATAAAQLYAAAKAEQVICDYPPASGQATVFSDATDV